MMTTTLPSKTSLKAWNTVKDSIVRPEFEIILHPSRRRLQWIGIFTVIGHLTFWWLWTAWFPQPFEDWRVRLFCGMMALMLIVYINDRNWRTRPVAWYFSFVSWFQLPFFFTWMYWMNAQSTMWMATVAVMIVIYYQMTDWRIATIGLALGFLGSYTAYALSDHSLLSAPAEHVLVFSFSWLSAMILALSSANLRRERLQQALTVIGIMAHELRTPLATLALIAHAIKNEAQSAPNSSATLEGLANRIDKLTRLINHHISLQMGNAKYSQFEPSPMEEPSLISAKQLLEEVIQDYPFESLKERQCITTNMNNDILFYGSQRWFTQVFNNLLKNALFALKAAESDFIHGDLHIELRVEDQLGLILIRDRGIGISKTTLPYIFEPFYSTASETGHGLGLAFCKQVVQAAQGQIQAQSEPGKGTSMTLILPCQSPATPSMSNPHFA